MAKKTYNEKLNSPGELPKIEDLSDKPESIKRFGGTKLLVAAPMQYNDIMAKIPQGKLTTGDRIREYLAAHVTEMNHSERFWAIVESVLPDYKQRQKRLKELQKRLSVEDWE